jgi:hypothetical protein
VFVFVFFIMLVVVVVLLLWYLVVFSRLLGGDPNLAFDCLQYMNFSFEC